MLLPPSSLKKAQSTSQQSSVGTARVDAMRLILLGGGGLPTIPPLIRGSYPNNFKAELCFLVKTHLLASGIIRV